jgi:hypothetical protein
MSLIFREIVNKRGKNKGVDNPSLQGCNVLGTHRPRDASSKGCIIQGCIIQGRIVQGRTFTAPFLQMVLFLSGF